MNKENVLAVADAIEGHTIPDLGFNMVDFSFKAGQWGDLSLDKSGHNCGTVACIAGWTRRIRTGKPLATIPTHAFDWSAELPWLGLSHGDGYLLFHGEYDDGDGEREQVSLSRVTPAQAVAVLRHLAETGEVDWSVAK